MAVTNTEIVRGVPQWTLSDRIIKARTIAGLDQTQLALAIGLSQSLVSKWEKGLREPKISVVRRIAEVTNTEGRLEHDPMPRVARAKAPQYLPRPISERDLEKAVRLAAPKMRVWLILGAYAGLRCTEIAHLRPGDVHDGSIHIRDSKGGRSRVVPVHARVADALDELGARWWNSSASSVSVLISRHLHRCGLDATAHQLRHRFATQVYEATSDLNVVRELLGHSSVATTQIYAAVSSDRRRRAVALIA